MTFQIQCSNCGHQSRKFDLSKFPTVNPAQEIVGAGWDSFGSVYYCPECVRTWEQRNGKDRPLWGAVETTERIYHDIIREQQDEIEYLNERYERAAKAAAKYNKYWEWEL